jgi:TRAP-type C4-dicarboxylate transport system substrate-binding protein
VKKLVVFLSLSLILLLAMGSAISCSSEPEGTSEPSGPSEPSEPSEPVVLTLSTTLPPDQAAVLEDLAANFNERAAAYNYSIEVYPGGVLASMEEAMDMVMSGAIDMAEIGLSAAMTHDLRFGAGTGIPFLIDDMDASIKYVDIINENLFSGIMEDDFSQKIITAWPSPPLYWCGIEPVETLEDWDGLLVHTMSTLQSDSVEALGASSVSMPFFDVVPSMEKGLVDGGVNLNSYAIEMLNWIDSFNYFTVADMFCGFIAFTVNLDAFNAMPAEVQAILLEEGATAGQTLTDLAKAGADSSLQACIDIGIEVYYLPDTERDRWIEATQAVRDAYFDQLDPADAQIILDAAAEANAD